MTSRRAILAILAGLAGSAIFAWRYFTVQYHRRSFAELSADERAAREWLHKALPRQDSIDAIGRAFLAQHPDEDHFGWLSQAALELKDVDDLRKRSQEDFAKGEMVEVRGWLLARNEARVCAFLYLVR